MVSDPRFDFTGALSEIVSGLFSDVRPYQMLCPMTAATYTG